MQQPDSRAAESGAVAFAATCPLCGGGAGQFCTLPPKAYYRCTQCSGVFLDQACYIPRDAERERYAAHNNTVDDPGYQRFVEPIVSGVQERFTRRHRGLDYGAGTGPVITALLRDNGYSVELYDPFFWDNPGVLQKKYDFIVCCEVMEHFHSPAKEFSLLRSLLLPGGVLFCMTDVYSERTNFENWYYKNDPTHVFFYHEDTLKQIAFLFGFQGVEHSGRLIRFLA